MSLQKLEMNGALSLSFPAEKEWSRGNYPQSIKILDYRSLSNLGSTEKNWTKWQYFVLLSSLRTDISGRNEQALFWSTFWTVVVVEKGGDRFPSRDIDLALVRWLFFWKKCTLSQNHYYLISYSFAISGRNHYFVQTNSYRQKIKSEFLKTYYFETHQCGSNASCPVFMKNLRFEL